MIKDARGDGGGGGGGGGGAPAPAEEYEDPDYVKCPTCGRTFNSQAAERHMPQCAKNPKMRVTRLAKGGGLGAAAGRRTVESSRTSLTASQGTFGVPAPLKPANRRR